MKIDIVMGEKCARLVPENEAEKWQLESIVKSLEREGVEYYISRQWDIEYLRIQLGLL